MNEQVEFVTMSNREKYLFDLQGFLVVKDFLSNTEVCALNEAIDANHDKRREHPKADLNGTPLDGEFGPFWHYNGMLTWLPPGASLSEIYSRIPRLSLTSTPCLAVAGNWIILSMFLPPQTDAKEWVFMAQAT
ncbi:MAG: phytanoyl-CoA dioxygenase family protein [Dehalococcoidia bacterium]|nr:phytanoyl-CoA dioxygenase family protein [Dehalococcoidia bacterium]